MTHYIDKLDEKYEGLDSLGTKARNEELIPSPIHNLLRE